MPAIYRDENWEQPKRRLNGDDLTLYRQAAIEPEKNRALAACEDFFGDVLIVESENDTIVPHPVIENYLAAFKHARSLSHRVMAGADHAMSKRAWRQAYVADRGGLDDRDAPGRQGRGEGAAEAAGAALRGLAQRECLSDRAPCARRREKREIFNTPVCCMPFRNGGSEPKSTQSQSNSEHTTCPDSSSSPGTAASGKSISRAPSP